MSRSSVPCLCQAMGVWSMTLGLLLLPTLCGLATSHPHPPQKPGTPHAHASELAQALGLHLEEHHGHQHHRHPHPQPSQVSPYMWAVYVADELSISHRNNDEEGETTRTIASAVLAEQCTVSENGEHINLTFNISQLREEELSHAEIVFTSGRRDSQASSHRTPGTMNICSPLTGCVTCEMHNVGSWTLCRFEMNITKSTRQNLVTFEVGRTSDISIDGVQCPSTEGPVLVLHRHYPETREMTYISEAVHRRKRDAQGMEGLLEHVRADRKRRNTHALEELHDLKPTHRDTDDPCQLHDWYVSFRELGWQHFIIAPSGVQANYCFGYCHNIELTTVNNMHAIARNHYLTRNGQRDGSPPAPHCSPTAWDAMNIMMYKEGGVEVLRVEKMKVSACSCR